MLRLWANQKSLQYLKKEKSQLEMLDRLIYRFCGFLDDSIAFVETYAIRLTEWCWISRVRLLNKRRKNVTRRTDSNK